MADKEPRPGEHEAFIRPLWKQGVGSTVHCVAGDATGIIVAAVIVALIGLPMWQDLIIEYVAGFLFGLLIFQALFMRRMMGGTYLQNVRRSFLPELISMNCMLAGMARSEEHQSELQSLMRISYAVFCLKKQKSTQYT